MRTLFYVCIVVVISSCNLFSDPTKGFSDEIKEVVPQWLIDDLRENNMNIYEGKRPPNVEGAYFISPLILVKEYTNGDLSPGYHFVDYSCRFYNQSAKNQKISVEYESDDGDGYGDGHGNTYVSGHRNYFTIFSEIKGVNRGIATESIEVISGEITREGGIKDFTHSITVKSKGLDINNMLMPVGATRIVKDGDGYSEKYSAGFRMSAEKEISDTSRPCMLCAANN